MVFAIAHATDYLLVAMAILVKVTHFHLYFFICVRYFAVYGKASKDIHRLHILFYFHFIFKQFLFTNLSLVNYYVDYKTLNVCEI